ncbi:uncharacterized protein LOC106141791 [Amyelois transitella]|uniref:uncharacterized protein LOC106141791 n=1 Tax=Amyelois transitella TaxID=680683 RepID=UPI00298F7CFC|nr:uncharacterized protein LOC106141791 [Amyelois transitella]
MRWISLILACAVLSTTFAEPDPKKYKPDTVTKNKNSNSSLTDEERKFLREVEAKFGVKSDVLPEIKKVNEEKNKTETKSEPSIKPPFPAVIAIEIVNDTESKPKNGKRTIDANLGYGYRTNNGYTYSYLGRPGQEKGKFMIYPYSQEDIPPARPNQYSHQSSGSYTSSSPQSPNVEIQPSKAYELVEMKDEPQPYQYNRPTEQRLNYDIKGLVTPPAYTPQSHQQPIQAPPTTLYTTYNGERLSGLSGQFPMVMPNYFVDPSQLLKYPQFQSAGLSQDHLRSSGSPVQQKVVPVLVLRIPSSYIKNPSAELYANLPQNYPLSQYLNQVNLQELVNNYFKKIGYSFAPQVMAYQRPLLADAVSTPVTQYEPQHYSAPYINPSYTQSDYSGVQYSAVKPVMARYPLSYTRPQYYIPSAQTAYQQPAQQYQYTYQYVPNTSSQQTYYIQPQSQQTEQEHQTEQVSQQTHVQDTANQVEYVSQQEVHVTTAAPSLEYGTPETPTESEHNSVESVAPQYEAAHASTQEYGTPKAENVEYASKEPAVEYTGPTRVNIPVAYTTQGHHDTIAVYPSQAGHIPRHYSSQADLGAQYYYQGQSPASHQNSNLVLTENYPSKDHTIATVLPYSYKQAAKSNAGAVQSVSYVTPMPFSSKYQSQYRIMVPQMVFKNPSSEKVAYVNSHSLPYSQNSQEHNPEAEYTVPSHYSPPVGRQRPPSYPKNYHSTPKRMVKPQDKSDNVSPKKQVERSEKEA